MKELIKYALPGGSVIRDTRELKRASRNINRKANNKKLIDSNGFEWIIKNSSLTLKGDLKFIPAEKIESDGVLSFQDK